MGVVEHLAEIILEYGENRHALKAKGMSLERLGRQKEAIPVWEDILRLDRFDAEVAKKLSLAIMDDDPSRGVHYMKMALEGFIRNGQFKSIQDIWNKLVELATEDLVYFERVERMLLDAKRQDLAVSLIRALYEEHRDTDPPQAIRFIKKILRYQTDDQDLRRDVIHLFKICYGEHSLFEQFLQLSQLSNSRVPLDAAIRNFENSIVFDRGNYVHHRTWGVGLISDMDHQNVIIDFQAKPSHKMSLQMALQSLTSVPKRASVCADVHRS
jgi:transcription elongation factor GreA-like protein